MLVCVLAFDQTYMMIVCVFRTVGSEVDLSKARLTMHCPNRWILSITKCSWIEGGDGKFVKGRSFLSFFQMSFSTV